MISGSQTCASVLPLCLPNQSSSQILLSFFPLSLTLCWSSGTTPPALPCLGEGCWTEPIFMCCRLGVVLTLLLLVNGQGRGQGLKILNSEKRNGRCLFHSQWVWKLGIIMVSPHFRVLNTLDISFLRTRCLTGELWCGKEKKGRWGKGLGFYVFAWMCVASCFGSWQ